MEYIARHYNMDLSLVWALRLEGKTNQEKFKKLGWGLLTWDQGNFNECDERFGDAWPTRTPDFSLPMCSKLHFVMEVSAQEIQEYIKSDGKNLFRGWLRSLQNKQARARIRVRLNRIRLGNFGDAKAVGNGVNEIRIHHGPGYRSYFGRVSNTIVLLLCGGGKKTQHQDIQKAQAFWKDYQERPL